MKQQFTAFKPISKQAPTDSNFQVKTNHKYKVGDHVFYHEGKQRGLDSTYECKILKVLPNKEYVVERINGEKYHNVPEYLLKMASDKGVQGKNCNRTSCQESPATFLHTNGYYYCMSCAMRIRGANPGYHLFSQMEKYG